MNEQLKHDIDVYLDVMRMIDVEHERSGMPPDLVCITRTDFESFYRAAMNANRMFPDGVLNTRVKDVAWVKWKGVTIINYTEERKAKQINKEWHDETTVMDWDNYMAGWKRKQYPKGR
jgi:hypothetical protein